MGNECDSLSTGNRSLTFHMKWFLLILVLIGPAGLAPAQSADSRQALREEALRVFRRAIHQAVWDRVIAGGAWWVERQGAASHGAYGFALKSPEKIRAGEDTIFDVASLTKVAATTPCVMALVEVGKVELEKPLADYLPEFTGAGRERITVRQLLTHTSGLRAGLPRDFEWAGYEKGIELACATVPLAEPDTVFRYSDVNFILLGELVRRVSGEPLNVFAKKRVFEPLGMTDTGFLPDAALRGRIAATEKDEHGNPLRGVVHDPTARRMGGVAGHAGLFATAADLARYARCVLNGGELDGRRILRAETVRLMTAVATPEGMAERRAPGWDVDTPYSRPRGGFPVGASFGHTGFTGCCLWLDPASETFFVFLGSRLHETDRDADSRLLYEVLGGHAARAAGYD